MTFGEGPVVMGTKPGLRRAHAHSRHEGGAEPVKGDVERSGWGGRLARRERGLRRPRRRRGARRQGPSVSGGRPHASGADRGDQPGPRPTPRLSDLGTNRIESAPAPGPELAN